MSAICFRSRVFLVLCAITSFQTTRAARRLSRAAYGQALVEDSPGTASSFPELDNLDIYDRQQILVAMARFARGWLDYHTWIRW